MVGERPFPCQSGACSKRCDGVGESASEIIRNAEAAVLELSMFFIRHGMPLWPARLSPVLEALRDGDGKRASAYWGQLALMGEYGLMQTRIGHEEGYRVPDPDNEQRHFDGLLQQALDTMNNLRHYLRSGMARPLVAIMADRPL